MALIACKGLSLRYENRLAVEDVSFEIEAGDYVCIVGENGSGKSTLLKGLLGLKTPDAGSISYGEGLKQRMIGYLPQQTVVQKDFPASVYEVVLSGCLNRRGCAHSIHPPSGRSPSEIWNAFRSGHCVKSPIETFPAANNSASCWRARSAPPKSCSCSMNR